MIHAVLCGNEPHTHALRSNKWGSNCPRQILLPRDWHSNVSLVFCKLFPIVIVIFRHNDTDSGKIFRKSLHIDLMSRRVKKLWNEDQWQTSSVWAVYGIKHHIHLFPCQHDRFCRYRKYVLLWAKHLLQTPVWSLPSRSGFHWIPSYLLCNLCWYIPYFQTLLLLGLPRCPMSALCKYELICKPHMSHPVAWVYKRFQCAVPCL